jgi:hypothetical protein
VPSLAATAAQVLRAQEALLRLADRADLEARRRADEDTAHARAADPADEPATTTTVTEVADQLVLERG